MKMRMSKEKKDISLKNREYYDISVKDQSIKEAELKNRGEMQDNLYMPFKAGHVAYTSKYELYWTMKQQQDESRVKSRRIREQSLLQSVVLLGNQEEKMKQHEIRKQQHIANYLQLEKSLHANAIKLKSVPDYQRQWLQFQTQMETAKHDYSKQLQAKYRNLKEFQLNENRKRDPLCSDDLDHINDQIRRGLESRRKAKAR